MRNLKKLLAVIVTLTMLVTMTIPAFAADTAATTTTAAATKTDADICKDLGVLKGDGSNFTTYLTQQTTRLQAATLYLRLLGKEAEAYAFTGTATFKDAGLIKYANGKALLAFLKANPDLGWEGDGVNFKPNDQVTAQELYKVMLTVLGYTVGDGKDFKYADTIKFAGEKGLTKAAALTSMKNSDTASVLVETLKAKLKDGSKTLLADLIAKKVIDEKAAETAGMVASATISSVSAIDATTIKVTFDKAITVAAADFKVVDSASKDMAVASLSMADANKTAVLKVAEMTVGSKYTLTYGATSKDVVPTVKDDTTKPALASAEAITGTLVRATFATRNINQDTLVAANFTLDNSATVSAVSLDTTKMAESGQEANTVVLLTVSGLKSGKAFVLTSSKVASYEGAVATTSTATFAGKDADTTAPGITYAKSEAGYQVELKFDEAGLVNETALDIANYSISPSLTIKSAKWKKHVLGDNVVMLTTDDQKSSTAYTITVNKISDGTNVMSTAKTFIFAGVDKVKNQALDTASPTDATKVLVTFKYEANDTALNIANYTINNGITVTAAAFKVDTSDPDGLNQKQVILTTSAMKSATAYTLTVGTGVQDVLGQGLSAAATTTFAGKDPDTSFGSISVESTGKNSVKVTFGEEVDRITATTLANYKISDLGYPSSISLDSTGTIATLTVADQTSAKSYTVTFNNIKDIAGNVVTANTTKSFTGIGDVTTDLRVTGASALANNKVKVTFNQYITGNINDDGDFLITNTSTTTDTLTFAEDNEVVAENYIILTVNSTKLMNASSVYKIEMVDADNDIKGAQTNFSINHDYDEATTVGSDASTYTFGVESIQAIDKTHVEVKFDRATTAVAANIVANTLKVYTNSDLSTRYSVDSTDVGNVITTASLSTDKKTLTLELNKALADNAVYYVTLERLYAAANFATSDGAVLAVETDKTYKKLTLVTGTLSAAGTTKLDIESATMMDVNTIDVVFNVNANMVVNDTSKVLITAASSDTANITGVSVVKLVRVNEKKLRIYFTGADKLTANTNGMYYVKLDTASYSTAIGTQVFATDKQYESFAVTSTANAKVYVGAVETVTTSKVKVTLTEDAYKDVAQTVLDKTNFKLYNVDTSTTINANDYSVVASTVPGEENKVFYLTLATGQFVKSGNYRLGLTSVVDESGKATDNYVVSSTDYSYLFGGNGTKTTPVVSATIPVGNATTVTVTVTEAGNVYVGTTKVNDASNTFATWTKAANGNNRLTGISVAADLSAGAVITFTLTDCSGASVFTADSIKVDLSQLKDAQGHSLVNGTTAANTVLTIADTGEVWTATLGAN